MNNCIGAKIMYSDPIVKFKHSQVLKKYQYLLIYYKIIN